MTKLAVGVPQLEGLPTVKVDNFPVIYEGIRDLYLTMAAYEGDREGRVD